MGACQGSSGPKHKASNLVKLAYQRKAVGHRRFEACEQVALLLQTTQWKIEDETLQPWTACSAAASLMIVI